MQIVLNKRCLQVFNYDFNKLFVLSKVKKKKKFILNIIYKYFYYISQIFLATHVY